MPAFPRINVKRSPSGSWIIDLAAGMSETGKKRRLTFPTRDAAGREKKRLEALHKEHGFSDAARAARILAPTGASLTDAATQFRERWDAARATVTLDVAWENTVSHRRGKRSPKTISELKKIRRKLPAWLAEKPVTEISPSDIKKAVAEMTPSDSYRRQIISRLGTVFKDAKLDGFLKGVIPTDGVRRPEIEKKDPEIFESAAELQNLLDIAAAEYPESVIPFCILSFAGVRPAELERMDWADINVDDSNIRIRAKALKTNTVRNIPIEPNLRAWLETVPEEERVGPVKPKGWKAKRERVRELAGVAGKHDIARHSYGSYWLSAYEDGNALLLAMGHSSEVHFKHYHRAVRKKDALQYWQITPEGAEVKTIREVA